MTRTNFYHRVQAGSHVIFLALILFSAQLLFSQDTFTLTGKVYNNETREVLPFATIYNATEYAISNEEGVFELKLKKPGKWIKVNYVGFKPDSIAIGEGTKNLDIYLLPQPTILKDIVVSAKSGNFRYKLFFKAIDSYLKNGLKEFDCKSYYRTYTLLNNNQPAELFESFYNITCNAQGVNNLKLKGGRFLLPRKKTFINMASTVLIEMFKPFNEGQEIFPYSPLQCVSVMHLKNRFNVTIKNIIRTENDTLYHFTFEPVDSVDAFSGELFYYKAQNRVEKLKLFAGTITKHPLYSMRDPVKDRISNLKYFIEIGYKPYKNKNLISYINFDVEFGLNSGKKNDLVKTNMKMINFDYEKHFSLPLYPNVDFKYDYEKVAAFPYNAPLFENNQFIKEGKNEILVRSLFDSIRCYNSESLDESLLFIEKRFQRWSPGWVLDDDLVDTFHLPEAHIHYENNYSKSKKALWDSVFACTFIFLDYDCYADTAVFTTNALLDYKFSFMMNKNEPIDADYFKLYLNSCKSVSNRLSKYLGEKYKNKCPTDEEIKEDYKKYSIINTTDAYLIHTTGNSPNKASEYPNLETHLLKNLDVRGK